MNKRHSNAACFKSQLVQAAVLAGRSLAPEKSRFRSRRLHIASGQCVTWCCNTGDDYTVFCMNGIVSVKTRDIGSEVVLEPGESAPLSAGKIHYVAGFDEQPCQCMIVLS